MRRTALVAALTCLALPSGAAADQIVTLEADGEAHQGTLGQPLSSIAEWGEIVSAAFDESGRLWLSQWSQGGGCLAFRPDDPENGIDLDDVSFVPVALQRGQSGCWIGRGPGKDLLFTSSNGTGASTAIWRLDTDRWIARYLHGGLEGTVSPGGALAVSQYSYYPRLGSYIGLRVGRVSAPRQLRPAWRHARRSGADRFPYWTKPAYSATGRLAVVRRPERGGAQILVGRPGVWRAVWKPGRAVFVSGLGWTSSGDLVVSSTLRGRATIRIFPGARSGSGRLLYRNRGANGFALGPDPPAPSQ